MPDPPARSATPEQARALARHLVGADPSPVECARWLEAVAVGAAPLERPRDVRLWSVGTRSALLAGLVDAGLALTDPYSPVRQRTCLMLAVLEASPSHLGRFEARPVPPLGWLVFGWRGVVAVARAACGLVLVRTWGVLWR